MTLRRAFSRAFRLLLTLLAVLLVGFYGVSKSAERRGTPWPYLDLPTFLNRAPKDVRARSLAALEQAVREGATGDAARAELLRLGGAALPHVLPRLDSLSPRERGRVALALGPVALRMRVATPEEVATPERATLFFSRFWQDRSIEFRLPTVRRAVQRLSARSLTLRREDVIHADTYALEELIAALGQVRSADDVERVRRLHPVLMHVTARGRALPRAPTLDDAARAVEGWQLLWLDEGADYIVLEGPRRLAALVTETQYGKWLAQAFVWRLGRALDSSWVAPRVLSALPRSALLVLLLLFAGLLAAAASTLGDRSSGLGQRLRVRLSLASASLVASFPVVLTLALAFELASGKAGVIALCAEGLRRGDVNLTMGSLLGLTLLSELLVALPTKLSAELSPSGELA